MWFDKRDEQLVTVPSQFPGPLNVKSQRHKRSFSVNLGKKKSFIALPGLDCLAKAVGVNATPSGVVLDSASKCRLSEMGVSVLVA